MLLFPEDEHIVHDQRRHEREANAARQRLIAEAQNSRPLRRAEAPDRLGRAWFHVVAISTRRLSGADPSCAN